MTAMNNFFWNNLMNKNALERRNDEMLANGRNNYAVSRIHDDIDTLFDRAVRGFFTPAYADTMAKMFSPNLDLHADEKQYTVALELPGVDPADVKITLDDGMLTISGEKKCIADEGEQKKLRHRESVYGSFERAVSLPEDADAENITANAKNGVLTITIPRKVQTKPEARQITINSEA